MDADAKAREQHEQELRLSHALWTDPETAPEMAKLVEKVSPGAIHAAEAKRAALATITPEVESFRKERDDWRKERETEREQKTRAAAIDRVIEMGLMTREEVPEVEKLMRERYVADYEVAANFYRSQQEVAAPRSTSIGIQIPGLHGAGGEFFAPKDGPKLASRDPQERDQWARNRAMKDLADLRAGRHLDPAPWDAGLNRY